MSKTLDKFKEHELEDIGKVLKELVALCPFNPVDDRIVVVPVDAPPSEGGIVIPGSAQDKKTFCYVVAVGEGYRVGLGERRPIAFKVGDKVLMNNVNPECLWRESGIIFAIHKEGNVIATL